MHQVTGINPFSFGIDPHSGVITPHDNVIQRYLSHMKEMYFDQSAVESMLKSGDPLLYEVYEVEVPDEEGHLMVCTSILYPGKVGKEYYMTKGHYHEKIATGEVYYCLRGEGCMLMESEDGQWGAEPMSRGSVVYVPPFFAHRSVNTGKEPMISFCVYPGGAGHDYASIETMGFKKLVVERDLKPCFEDNPRWRQGSAG